MSGEVRMEMTVDRQSPTPKRSALNTKLRCSASIAPMTMTISRNVALSNSMSNAPILASQGHGNQLAFAEPEMIQTLPDDV